MQGLWWLTTSRLRSGDGAGATGLSLRHCRVLGGQGEVRPPENKCRIQDLMRERTAVSAPTPRSGPYGMPSVERCRMAARFCSQYCAWA
jgi:hypothetical protein